MRQATYKPPKCYCGAELTRVWENLESLYVFDKEIGTYQTNDMADEVSIICPMCEADVLELFPEGVCNYQAQEPK